MRSSICWLGLALTSCVGTAGRLPGLEDASTSGGTNSGTWRPLADAGFTSAGSGIVGEDAAIVVEDAGIARADSGSPVVDAGGGVDAGGPPVDARPPVDAGTCVPLQGTVTTIARGTYCVTGDVIIPTGVTLDIPAGTTFIVMGRHHFGRDPAIPDSEPPSIPGSGSIHAIGTAAEPIVFRGATPTTGWYGLVVSHSHDTVHLEYVTIRDTYKNDTNPSSRIWKRGGGLGSYVNAKGTILRHCTFINNRASSVAGALDINGHGQWPNAGPVEITDTLFENNYCECSTYSGSSIDLCGGGAIRFSHVGGDGNLVKIRNNVFRNNEARRTGSIDAYGGAIGGFDDGIVIGPGNVLDSNHATGDGAISCNHQATVGTLISAVDPSVIFTHNTPDNGCGK